MGYFLLKEREARTFLRVFVYLIKKANKRVIWENISIYSCTSANNIVFFLVVNFNRGINEDCEKCKSVIKIINSNVYVYSGVFLKLM